MAERPWLSLYVGACVAIIVAAASAALFAALILLAGVGCIVHGVRSWAGERLEDVARTDMREWYRQ